MLHSVKVLNNNPQPPCLWTFKFKLLRTSQKSIQNSYAQVTLKGEITLITKSAKAVSSHLSPIPKNNSS